MRVRVQWVFGVHGRGWACPEPRSSECAPLGVPPCLSTHSAAPLLCRRSSARQAGMHARSACGLPARAVACGWLLAFAWRARASLDVRAHVGCGAVALALRQRRLTAHTGARAQLCRLRGGERPCRRGRQAQPRRSLAHGQLLPVVPERTRRGRVAGVRATSRGSRSALQTRRARSSRCSPCSTSSRREAPCGRAATTRSNAGSLGARPRPRARSCPRGQPGSLTSQDTSACGDPHAEHAWNCRPCPHPSTGPASWASHKPRGEAADGSAGSSRTAGATRRR